MVFCLEQDADLHMAQLMPLPITVSCFSKIQIGFIFLVPAHLGSPGKTAVKQVCVCVIHLSGIHLERFDCMCNVCLSFIANRYRPVECMVMATAALMVLHTL